MVVFNIRILMSNPWELLTAVSTHGSPRRISKKKVSIISNRQVDLKMKRSVAIREGKKP